MRQLFLFTRFLKVPVDGAVMPAIFKENGNFSRNLQKKIEFILCYFDKF